MAAHVEGRLLPRSIPFLEKMIAELSVAATANPAAPPTAAKKKKAEAKGTTTAAAAAASSGSSMSKCHFVVGKVVEVAKHPESQKLYVEKIDLGEESGPRTILSGLQEHLTDEAFLHRLVLVIANLEPRKIAGIPSQGMVLCASEGEAKERVVLLDIPEGTPIGERVVFEGHDGPHEPVLKKKLAKHFEDVAAHLKTNEKGEACWMGLPFTTSRGTITAPIPNGNIS